MSAEHTGSVLDEIDAAIAAYQPVAIYALFSGGNDSLATTAISAQHPAFTAAVHLNTGIGIEETRRFVRETCTRERWPLIEKHPPGRSYDDLVCAYGFPGPAQHKLMYRHLKERALRDLVAETKRTKTERVLLVTGARATESSRRMHSSEFLHRQGAQVWLSPLHTWTALDVRRYLDAKELPRNPASDLLHLSGECLCGAFARPGELEEIKTWFPLTAQRIQALEEHVRATGKTHATWGWASGSTAKSPGMLCTSCTQ